MRNNMIYVNSRYYDGDLYQKDNKIFVTRSFPVNNSVRILGYIWRQNDRPDQVASYFLNDPNSWSVIMDLNPHIMDPLNIPAGTPIRIPYEL